MANTKFHRPARTFAPAVPEERVTLAPPPQKAAESGAQQWLYLLLPLLSSVSMGAYLVTFGKTWMIALGVVFVLASAAITLLVRQQTSRAARRAAARQRLRYQEYLTELRAQARASARAQRLAAAFGHPSIERLWAITRNRRRIWERRAGDPDFLQLRVGLGRAEAALRMQLPPRQDPTAEYDKTAQRAATRLMDEYAAVGNQPAWVALGKIGVLSVLGAPERAREVAANLLTQLAVLHGPEDVRVMILAGDGSWDWAKWLPHTQDPGAPAGHPAPMIATGLDGLADLLERRLEEKRAGLVARIGLSTRTEPAPGQHLVVVLDGYRPDAPFGRHPLIENLIGDSGKAGGLHVICLVAREPEEPGRVDARIRLGATGGLTVESRLPGVVSAVTDAVPDPADVVLSEHIARALAPLLLTAEREEVLTRAFGLPELVGAGDLATLDPTAMWRRPDAAELLRVPIGITGDGADLVLDLKESAQGGVGPHGLLVGATGSGKSELLRTLVASLAITHSPDELGMVLVDFKGGATFAGVTDLPHVAGLITNLADDETMIERMRVALHGELQRRQQLLRDAGNLDNVREYQLHRAAGGTDPQGRALEPLPYLMIFVDEFAELLSRRADFIHLFVQIGRLGRSLGMHLLMASQRIDEGRLRGLESHLSYRLCLRTFSAAESRAVIGTADAYKLPPIPGSAYFKVGETVYERFRVAHASAPYLAPDPDAPAPVTSFAAPEPFGLRTAEDARRAADAAEEPDEAPAPLPVTVGGRTALQVIVDRVRPCGTPVHQVWLPPLPPYLDLDPLVGVLETDDERGYHASGLAGGLLTFPVGVVDLPAVQEQRVLMLRLDDAGGHAGLVGAPQSGKSTLLRTALLSAMLTHTPDELQFAVIDFGGGTLAPFAAAPHVAGVAVRTDEERVRRTLAVAHQLLATREEFFAEHGIDSVAELRRRRDAGELPAGVNAADWVLVVDNWAALRTGVDTADRIVTEISARGAGVGVHLLLTANRWTEIRTSLRDNIGIRLELRLNEPAESEVNRTAAKALTVAIPGRGVCPPGDHFQAALPRLDGDAGTENLAKAQQAVLDEIIAGWPGASAPPVRTLPKVVTAAELDARFGPERAGVPIGVREIDLDVVGLDLTPVDPHLMVFGDSGAGKTSVLRAWMAGLARRRTAREARFFLIDYRAGLLGAVPDEYVGARAGNPDHVAAYVTQLLGTVARRRPPADVTAAQLRARSWWTGPELYVVVDDYDLVAGPGGRGPLAPLAEALGQAGDIGLHLVLARRVSGSARSMMSDPIVSRLKEYGATGLILSGDPREGVLLGDQRAARRDPGRGVLVSRSGAQVIQAARAADEEE
ncbi:type VII secretion protein EccCa [Actinoplanes sp. L3-i22]|uniref:type VII secretion protein EccCa n=1 Tax=Actinoplanes sp. L3-i22 TaxID=2836373 RepID=UPI001C78FEA4|nr:type VII secretion protein EccCa [Actinoplanes sp. L3-i22]BCY11905.1 type VII secretion protein EccC [Actinoplanes sp. L3-i22]